MPTNASYRVCAQGSTATLVADGFADACKTVVAGSRSSVDVGTVIAHRRPLVALSFRSTSGAVITGATIGWTTVSGTQQKDSDQFNVGRIVSVLPGPGTAVYCEIKAPKGFQFIDPVCAAVDVDWDTLITRVLTHEPLPKVQLP